jgi:DNA-directed RNA polymerase subunit RPC12/RpoP
MRPVRTQDADVTYLGPNPEIADLPVHRAEVGRIYATFALSDAERTMIANGAQVQIGIFTEPMPPISVAVVNEPESDGALGAKDYRCTTCEALYVEERAIALRYLCGRCGDELRLPEAVQ